MNSVEPELVLDVHHAPQNFDEICKALDLLYRSNHSIILQSERTIEIVHRQFLDLIHPVTAQLFSTVAHGRPFMQDDFIAYFTQDSYRMIKTMKDIGETYVRQHRRALLLAHMALM